MKLNYFYYYMVSYFWNIFNWKMPTSDFSIFVCFLSLNLFSLLALVISGHLNSFSFTWVWNICLWFKALNNKSETNSVPVDLDTLWTVSFRSILYWGNSPFENHWFCVLCIIQSNQDIWFLRRHLDVVVCFFFAALAMAMLICWSVGSQFWSRVKYLKTFCCEKDCCELLHQHSWSPEELLITLVKGTNWKMIPLIHQNSSTFT